ncbi:MAG: SPASM domain-containing protein [Candidatus Melainabacteria bacterium]|nr:SPASM domain-containing protein [Candidatus Melainabacteria bacterium]
MIRPQRHMERDIWNKIVEEVGSTAPNCELWPTFYGEALILGDKLWDRLDYARQVGCRNLVLNSNGTLLHRNDNIEKVLQSPLKRFILSLDGLNKETFEQIRVRAKWSDVYPAVVELCRKRVERKQEYPVIIAQFSVMHQNAHEIEAYSKYWHAMGAEVKIRPMLEWTASGSVRTDTIVHESNFRIACPWGNNTMAIHQDGSVVACAVDYEGRLKAGNVRDKTIAELWQILEAQLRTAHREHRWSDIPAICKGCSDWQTAGASYENETVEGTRPFWYYSD